MRSLQTRIYRASSRSPEHGKVYMALVILRTSRRLTFFSGALSHQAYRPSASLGANIANKVTAMAIDSLLSMRRKTQKVSSVDDRVGVIAKYIKQGESTGKARIMSGMATADFCGTEFCIAPHDLAGEIDAIHGFIKANVRYMADPLNHDTYDTADRSIELAFGDCDDIAIVSGAIFQHAGFPVRIKVIKTRGNNDFHHVYILVGTPQVNPHTWTPSDAAYYERAGQEASGIVDAKIYDVN